MATPEDVPSRFTFLIFDTYSGGGAAGTAGALACGAFAPAGLFGSPGLPVAASVWARTSAVISIR